MLPARAVALFAALLVLPHDAGSAPAARPALWFAPLPPLQKTAPRPYVGSVDFTKLFSEKAAWFKAARRVAVFKLYGEWVAHQATGTELRRTVTNLKSRKISLAVETGPLDLPPDCGQGVEGFSGAEGLATAYRIKTVGGTLRYLAFDEPFFYAALYTGPNACRWDTRRVAQAVAAYVKRVRTVFPNLKFGDTEPLTNAAQVQRYEEWVDAYREVTGENLAFLHLDVQYTLPRWPQLAHDLEEFARSRGIPFGVIYTGDSDDASDGAWLTKARQRFELYETEGGRPDHALLQSWHDKPDRMLPESRNTFTNLILRYTRPRTRLELQASTAEVEGRLLAQTPLAGKSIRISAERVYEDSAYPARSALATVSASTDAAGHFRVAMTGPPGAAVVARYPGSTGYWPAYAILRGSGVVQRNVAHGRSVVASAEQATTPASNAVDGDPATLWIAGDFAPEWIEIDLGAPVQVTAIRLGVAQTPREGTTVHAVLGRSPEESYRQLHVFSGRTTDGQLLEYVPATPWEDVRYLRVETRASPSWVAWREVEVFATD